MRIFVLVILFCLAGLPARAQTVYEASLSLGGGGGATIFSGKFWLRLGPDGQAEFQAAISSPVAREGPLSARIKSPDGAIDFALGHGGERVYSGCDPLGRNPYLALPDDFPLITCPAFMTAMFFQGHLQIPPALVTQLQAQRGIIEIGPAATGDGVGVSGSLQLTGVTAGRQYYLTPLDTAKVTVNGGVVRVTWAAQTHARYVVQSKLGLGAVWQDSGFVLVATGPALTVEMPAGEGETQRFFRILRLR